MDPMMFLGTVRSCVFQRQDTLQGHQSLRVNLESGPVVLTGDCVYWEAVLEGMLLPPFGFDHDLQLASMRKLRDLRDEDGCRLLYGHDATQWAGLEQSPSGII